MNSFPGLAGVICIGAFAPTGEPFTVLQDGGYATRKDAKAGAKTAFDEYAKDHTGTLYWRIVPEIAYLPAKKRYGYYMRLLISDKRVVTDAT